ncbi:DUF4855 domain-containing protein [Proteiniphilum sp. UBA5384]|uniref:DUF4855 domain-containing protein n=1 Tax=Proteiniphilum sp. UBA5384 TaxID=1947279 RepID=UPI0025F60341|nr:DUF4855 domain-containing protein [Proteiniphilum sp. UBA5384]
MGKTPFHITVQYSLILPAIITSILACSNSHGNKTDEDLIFKEDIELDNLKHHKAVPNDLVLIYDGGAHRNIKWDKSHFAPYIFTEKEGESNLLFDGFLFLEIKDGNGRGFASGYEKAAARKIEWEKLLENFFIKNNAIHALNEQIDELVKSRIIDGTIEKRKVILSIPEPIPNQKDWGELKNQKMDFSNRKDRLAACEWYIEYAEQLFKKANLKHVELVGFYWLAEEATNSRDLAKYVANYIYKKGYDFYWIPYFNSDGYEEWQTLGFNQIYYQPNYFFNESVPYSQLEKACQRAKDNFMHMEIEFDERVLASSGWGYRLSDYLDVFTKYGVFDTLKVAYYQGGDAFYQLSQSKDPEDQQLYNRLTDIIIKRQDVNFKKN